MQPFAGERAAGLHVPGLALDGGEVQALRDLCGAHGAAHVLLVGEHQQARAAQLRVRQHAVQLLLAHAQPLPVRRVDHHYHELAIGVVGVPGRAQSLLAAKVPHDEAQVPPDHFLNVGPNRWPSVDGLPQQELIQYCCLASIVQTNQDEFMFFVSK